MSCSSFKRCGGLMRGFLPIGSLIVTRGYGSCGDEEIIIPEVPLPEGIGRRVTISAAKAATPKTLIRYPDRKTGKCDDD